MTHKIETITYILIPVITFFISILSIYFSDKILSFLKFKKTHKILIEKELEFEKSINHKKAKFFSNLEKQNQKSKEHLIREQQFLNKRDKELKNKFTEISEIEKKLKSMEENYFLERENLKKERSKIIANLETISGLSKNEAIAKLFSHLEKEQTYKLNKLIKDKKDKVQKNLHSEINNILASAIERYASNYVGSRTISKIELKNEETKGKIIGKEGRNIKSFEEESGTDIIIENDSQVIKVSSFNPVRRAIAVESLKKLIQDGRIQPQRIKETLESEKRNIDLVIRKEGKSVIEELKIINMEPELIYHVGLLKYRTSYGQSVLSHSMEVAKIAGAMAKELNLDDEIAIRGGLLHDIGKSKDYEIGLSHVEVGVNLARKYQEDDTIVNIIHSHHDDVPKNNIYSVLVSAADTISAARPGARDKMQEDYIQRMETIERICSNVPGVKKSYAIKLGRTIRIIVDSSKVNDIETEQIADVIRLKLKEELKIPGEVLIEVIREFRIIKNI